MKYKFLKLLAVILMSITLFSCRKYLDINADPNNAVVGDPKSLFSFAISSFVNNRAGGDMYIPMALGGQSISSGGTSSGGTSWGSGSEDQYVFSPFSYSNIWTQYYTSVAGNLRKAIDLSETSLPKNENGAAQAKVVLAQTFYELTTTYGDIPFSEALDLNNLAPKFDGQQDVLNGCIALLDSAISQFDPASGFKFDEPYDMFYKGDIDKWIKVAKSIKLRILMTMADKDPTKISVIGDMIAAGGFIESANDNFEIAFENVAGKRNPKYQIKTDYNGDVDFFYASPYVLDFMQASNDPRIPFFYDKANGAATFHAIQPGDNADDQLDSKIASSLHSAAEPEYVFTYQELLFYEAEIYARGLGVTADMAMANTLYKQAVLESSIFFGVTAANATSFSSGLPALTGISNPLKQINYQHWIDKFDRGIDAFVQWRRSGAEGSETPDLTLPVGAPSGNLFRRYEYPQNAELAANPNALALIHFTEKVWFDL
jgi:hypothetical protein